MTSPSSLLAGPMGAVAQMMFAQPEQRRTIAKELAEYLSNAGLGAIAFEPVALDSDDDVEWRTPIDAAELLVNELSAAMGVVLSPDTPRLTNLFG